MVWNFTRHITSQTPNAATGIHSMGPTSVASCKASALPPISVVIVIRLTKNDAPRLATAARGPSRSETTGAEVGRSPTGQYPDGLAYDPRRNAIWTTNESGGAETVVDAATMQPRGSVNLGAEVVNVGYDQDGDRMLVAVQGRNDLAVIDPAALSVAQRVALPGCQHPHGLSIDSPDRLVFVACDQNATLLTIDQTNWNVTTTNSVGEDPDVLAYDPSAHRLYVAAESAAPSRRSIFAITL